MELSYLWQGFQPEIYTEGTYGRAFEHELVKTMGLSYNIMWKEFQHEKHF
jgi:hypothetical protein